MLSTHPGTARFLKSAARFVFVASFAATLVERARSDSPAFKADAIHPERRTEASPAGSHPVSVNPPSLLWPVTSGSGVRYQVRLSQEERFADGGTIKASDLRWAMFNPHRRLDEGTWYWQVGTTKKPGADAEWSPVHSFKVDDTAREFVTPPAAEMLGGVPRAHPRILVPADKLSRLRDKLQGTEIRKDYVRVAERLVGKSVRGVEGALPSETGKNQFESKNFAKWASKGYAGKLLDEIKSLSVAYLATGDERFAREAIRRGILVAGFDPKGPTSRSVSDFADGSCMEALALVYDCCHDLLSDSEKAQLRDAMVARVAPWFARQMNDLESRVFNAHIWQHILQQATEVALALYGDVPEAELWLSYVYELWPARVPLLGGDDGGWANGISYFGTNFKTLMEMPTLLRRFSGVDFCGHPWYRNTIYYQLYAWPPGSASDGFGDGAERPDSPSGGRAMFAHFLATRFQDPVALWYARQIVGNRNLDSLLPPMLLFDRVLSEGGPRLPEPALPDDLPQARAFRDIGLVTMHTDLAAPQDNLMLAYRSSPFGSYNHMHSDQNALHIVCGGKRLFSGSGYYIAYGDEHFQGWYTHTRGQNSILIDGKGQVRGAEGYGWIARYLHGRQITYCTGDASSAYGDAGLTRFRRHVAFLRPDIVVIYDDLQADHAAEWSWLLHSPGKIETDVDTNRFLATTDNAQARINMFASSPVKGTVSDQFDPPALNWRDKKDSGKTIKYPNQWHLAVVPNEKSAKARFLAVLQIRPGKATTPEEPRREADGTIRVADWRITAGLDSSRPASLLIDRADGGAALAVDCAAVTVAGTEHKLSGSESLLVEAAEGIVCRCGDELPEAAR
ncbi:MAG: DUF4962 domain-containing protein [Planctomycetaceae bacterium]|nr:DUF4962 domain-containing protein [Planctomycetaceae bacterium]